MKQSFRNLHYALLTSDTAAGVTYETPEQLIGAISGKISPSSEFEPAYADDGIIDMAYAFGDIKVEIDLFSLPLAAQAKLLGHKYENGIMIKSANDQSPYLALGFMSKSSETSIEFVWLYKGRFALLDDEYSTATDKPEWRKPKLVGTFIKRVFDEQWEIVADSGTPDFDPDIATGWFTKVYDPAGTP